MEGYTLYFNACNIWTKMRQTMFGMTGAAGMLSGSRSSIALFGFGAFIFCFESCSLVAVFK